MEYRINKQGLLDCLDLIKMKKKEINIKNLETRYRKTASFDVSEDKVNKNLEYFLKTLEDEGLIP